MSLAPGTRLGPYQVVAPLGAGGMGEVYRANDAKLGREVALKLLPEAFASDPERIARFEREARLLASVNHPAIAHLYAFEKATLDGGVLDFGPAKAWSGESGGVTSSADLSQMLGPSRESRLPMLDRRTEAAAR
jgi:serine/threonine protein kinase